MRRRNLRIKLVRRLAGRWPNKVSHGGSRIRGCLTNRPGHERLDSGDGSGSYVHATRYSPNADQRRVRIRQTRPSHVASVRIGHLTDASLSRTRYHVSSDKLTVMIVLPIQAASSRPGSAVRTHGSIAPKRNPATWPGSAGSGGRP